MELLFYLFKPRNTKFLEKINELENLKDLKILLLLNGFDCITKRRKVERDAYALIILK